MIILNILQSMMMRNIITRAMLLMFVAVIIYSLFRRVFK